MVLADDLINLYAERMKQPGFAFEPDGDLQLEFESEFGYELTPDQAQAVEEIKKDMETPRPMDRLLCGDVGFGKTEVALRACFKAVVCSKKQCAFSMPYYNSFSTISYNAVAEVPCEYCVTQSFH